MEALRQVIAGVIGVSVRKRIAVFRDAQLCRSTRGTIRCGAIGTIWSIRVATASLASSLLSVGVSIGATNWSWQSVAASRWSALNVRAGQKT